MSSLLKENRMMSNRVLNFMRRLLALSIVVLSPCLTMGADCPNILWLTSEDHGPEMGCYGDRLARTPNVDSLAAKGMIFKRAWSVAPVCAPARTAIISGLYPCSTGGLHMRSMVSMPTGTKMAPQFLSEAGYYCTNNSKTDYNLREPGKVWDESSGKAVAAQALELHGDEELRSNALKTLASLASPETNGVLVAMSALGAIESLGAIAAPMFSQIAKINPKGPSPDKRYDEYVGRLISNITSGEKSIPAEKTNAKAK